MEKFKEILKQIIVLAESNPEMEVEELIQQKKEELGINEALLTQILQSLKCIDKFDEKYLALQKAKNDGMSRTEWFAQDVEETASKNGLSEEQTRDLIKSLNVSLDKNLMKEE